MSTYTEFDSGKKTYVPYTHVHYPVGLELPKRTLQEIVILPSLRPEVSYIIVHCMKAVKVIIPQQSQSLRESHPMLGPAPQT